MEQVEFKKKIEKRKAQFKFLIILLLLLVPTFIIQFSDKKEILALSGASIFIIFFAVKIQKLNQKLQQYKFNS